MKSRASCPACAHAAKGQEKTLTGFRCRRCYCKWTTNSWGSIKRGPFGRKESSRKEEQT